MVVLGIVFFRNCRYIIILRKNIYEHRPQIAWKGVIDFLPFVEINSRYVNAFIGFVGPETNMNTDI